MVHSVNYSFPASGDSNPNNWGRPALYFLGGWFTSSSNVWWAHSFQEYPGTVAYCIEPGAARDDSTVNYTSRGADYWASFVSGTAGTHGSVLNPTVDGATIRTLIGRVMQYGYQGDINTAWKSQNSSAADKLANLIATQILIWETIVGERDAAFEHVDPSGTGTYKEGSRTFTHARNAVLEYISADHPLRARILSHYDRIVGEVKKNAVLPSFMSASAGSAQTVELKWNNSATWADGKYTVTLTDSNNVLGSFTFSGEGLTFSVSGKKLTITSDAPITSAVTITASTTRQTNSFLTWSDGKVGFNVSSKQDVVTYGASVADSVTAYLKVKAPTTRISVTKESDDGVVARIPIVLKYGTETVATKRTSTSGKANFTGLPVGATFTVEETVPSGYAAEQASQNVTTEAGGSAVTFVNHKIVTLDIVKTSDDGAVAGIPFTVKEGKKTVFTGTTDKKGKLTVPDLRIGQVLTVTETVPAGYTAEARSQKITLTAGTNALTFVNRRNRVSLDLVKESGDGNVAGISFEAEKAEGSGWTSLGTFVTDESGALSIPDLFTGTTVRITETVPEWYRAEERTKEITVTEDSHAVTFVNHPLADLTVVKTSDDGNISGIPFRLTQLSPEEKDLGDYETDEEGRIAVTGLDAGAVIRLEETVPEGYVSDEPAKEITLVRGVNEIAFANRRILGSLRIVKTARLSETETVPLAGAVFALFDAEGEPAAEAATDEDGIAVFADLPYGTYTYREIRAPEGFEADPDEYGFRIREENETIEHACENDRKTGSLSVYKTDENGLALPGVVFYLEFSTDEGETWAPVRAAGHDFTEAGACASEGLTDGTLTTGEDGKAVFSGLAVSTSAQTVLYRLTEVRTKNGYSLLKGSVFEGELTEAEGTDLGFTVVNHPTFTMPLTGGNGFRIFLIEGAAAAFAAGGVTLLLCRKNGNRRRHAEHPIRKELGGNDI